MASNYWYLIRARAFQVSFVLILALGIFARAWEFGRLPPGLNADEASIGVEAWNLYHFGIDRNGMSFPVHLVAWGSGQNALYPYFLLPFVGVLGLKTAVVRLPMLLTGILSLPLMYSVGAASFGRRVGLLAMFLLAISPWHILLSRWGLESNIFPFVFLGAYACLIRFRSGTGWLVLACALFGLCLFAYGTAYAVVPAFMAAVLIIMLRHRLIRSSQLGMGLVAFAIVAAPIILMLIINVLNVPSIKLDPITIPRFPVPARYEYTTLLGTPDFLGGLTSNLNLALRLLATESDGLIYNGVEPFGFFYHLGLPIAILGIVVMALELKGTFSFTAALLSAWLGAAALIGAFQPVNINRFNIIFLPLLLCGAYALDWFGRRGRAALPISIAALLMAFIAFTAAYHGASYRSQAAWKFHDGLLPALRFADSLDSPRVCVTDEINMPYIYALFANPVDPRDFLRSVSYIDANEPLRRVRSYGRYVFGVSQCTGVGPLTYVLTSDEIPPRLGNRYQYRFFDNFVVYFPRK